MRTGHMSKAKVETVDTRDKAGEFFKCTDEERAVFEAGIKLGGIYHQFIGATVSPENVDHLEKTMVNGITVQPFVEHVEAHIDRTELKEKRDPYDYITVTGKMLDVRITTRYGTARTVCRLRYIDELRYPLMYIEKVERV